MVYSDEIEIEEIDAEKLIVPERLDLIAKLLYIEYRQKGIVPPFIKEIYRKTIEAFSLGLYVEPRGEAEKNSFNDYINVFDDLINNIKNSGMDFKISTVPVGSDGVLLNGAHRTAICAYYRIPMPITRTSERGLLCDASFFKERLLSDEVIEYLICEYCKRKDSIYIACIWPVASKAAVEMINIISENAKIIYRKEIDLKKNALHNFIVQIYARQNWIGDVNNCFTGAFSKAESCYKDKSKTVFYVLESNSFDNILKLKERFRCVCGIGNHSIHVTDNSKESVQIANIIFNKNSLDLLMNGNPYCYPNSYKMIQLFKQNLMEKGFALDDFALVSNNVMALYGMCDVNDMYFITIDKNDAIEKEFFELDKTQEYEHLCNTSAIELLLNPDNFLIYDEIKLISLDVLKRFKAKNGQESDMEDIYLINRFRKRAINLKSEILKMKYEAKLLLRNITVRCSYILKLLLKVAGLFEKVKRIYHLIKGEKNSKD